MTQTKYHLNIFSTSFKHEYFQLDFYYYNLVFLEIVHKTLPLFLRLPHFFFQLLRVESQIVDLSTHNQNIISIK